MPLNSLARKLQVASERMFLDRKVTDFVRRSGFGNATKEIMDFYGKLGKEEGYFVAANNCQVADQGSWLYDMLWWNVNNDGMMGRIAVALESELKPGGNVLNAFEVDGDFQKLVQARADVRIWLALIPNNAMATRHVENCKRQAAAFDATCAGDTYIMIVGDWTEDKFEVITHQV